eukprot:Hpha_TRINITY_DN9668_c0_g1::TRINITY_DN9668_c0_g1_i1::g.184330::m.184330
MMRPSTSNLAHAAAPRTRARPRSDTKWLMEKLKSREGSIQPAKSEQPGPTVYGMRGYFNALGRRITTENVIQPYLARKVQAKRDWYNTYVSLCLYKREKEGLPLYESDIESMFLRKEHLTWSSFYQQRRNGHAMILRQVEQALRAVKNGRLEEHLGFGLTVRPSTLPKEQRCFSDGQGLFVEGRAPQGTVLGLVPGVAWWGWHKGYYPWAMDTDGTFLRNSPHLFRQRTMIDGVVMCSDLARYGTDFRGNESDEEVDLVRRGVAENIAESAGWYGKPLSGEDAGEQLQNEGLWDMMKRSWGPTLRWIYYRGLPHRSRIPWVGIQQWAAHKTAPSLSGLKWDHGFSRANYINHCGNVADPNVIFMPVSIPASFPRELIPYFPVRMNPASRYGSGRMKQIIEKDCQTGLMNDIITCNHQRLSLEPGKFSKREGEDLLVMLFGVAAVALRPIENEEVFQNLRLSPHPYYQRRYPAWYQPCPEGEESENWLYNNLWPPGTSFGKRTLGIYDPGVTVNAGLADPRLMDRDWIYYLMRLA